MSTPPLPQPLATLYAIRHHFVWSSTILSGRFLLKLHLPPQDGFEIWDNQCLWQCFNMFHSSTCHHFQNQTPVTVDINWTIVRYFWRWDHCAKLKPMAEERQQPQQQFLLKRNDSVWFSGSHIFAHHLHKSRSGPGSVRGCIRTILFGTRYTAQYLIIIFNIIYIYSTISHNYFQYYIYS